MPTVSFPTELPDTASYEEQQAYLVGVYRATLEIALPKQQHEKPSNACTQQTASEQCPALYQRLKFSNTTSAIRLLEVLPGSPENPSVETQLIVADLNSGTLRYDALSYVWGVPSKPQDLVSISVNGFERRITPNLYGALMSLRSDSEKRVLWIDSICINQNDLEERSQQVLLMAKIYSRASRVLVYLGPSTPSSDAYFTFLQSCDIKAESAEASLLDADQKEPAIWEAVAGTGLDVQTVIDGFMDVCSRSWWKRLWILQEYTLATQDPWLYCGRLKVPNLTFTKYFKRTFDWAEHRKIHPLPIDVCPNACCVAGLKNERTGEQVMAYRNEITDISHRHRKVGDFEVLAFPNQSRQTYEWKAWGEQVWQASRVLNGRAEGASWLNSEFHYHIMSAECSDPHDVVYAVREMMEPTFRDIFRPDYTLPVSTLFTELAAYTLILDMFPDVFWYFPHSLRSNMPKGEDELLIPSWVSDFTKGRHLRHADKAPHDEPLRHRLQRYREPRISNRMLLMDGFVVDHIINIFLLPAADPFKLLQAIWYTEKGWGKPAYLGDGERYAADKSFQCSQRVTALVDKFRGLTPFPGVAWATKFTGLPQDISICDFLAYMPNFDILMPRVEEFASRIPNIVDNLIICLAGQEGMKEDGISKPHFGLDASPNVETSDERTRRIFEMRARLIKLWELLLIGDKVEFVGSCVFDYNNLRAQVLHRLALVDEATLSITEGELGGASASMDNPITYEILIDVIEKDCEGEEELRLREEVVIYLATTIHDVAGSLVGLEGHRLCQCGGDVDETHAIDDDDGKRGEVVDEVLVESFMTVPLSTINPERFITERQQPETLSQSGDQEGKEGSGGPHSDSRHPHKAWQFWQHVRPQQTPEVDFIFRDLIDFLAGREFFVTREGLLGMTYAGTQGVRPGDELLVMKSMSFPLIGRPELPPGSAEAEERSRREIVGTAVVKGLDVKSGNLNDVVWPGEFVPFSGKDPGTLMFV